MENKFALNEDEKKRILDIHKYASKNHYLRRLFVEQTSGVTDTVELTYEINPTDMGGDYEKTSDFCSISVNNTTENTFPPNDLELIKKIGDVAQTYKTSSIENYKSWYDKPDTKLKIAKKELLEKLPVFLDGVLKNKFVFITSPEKSPNAKVNAWVLSPKSVEDANQMGSKFGKIYINLFNLHNGKDFTSNFSETIRHEIGHLIDAFFRINGENIYKDTHPPLDAEAYKKNYIINDADQFSRLSVFRNLVGAEPYDDVLTLRNKFMAKVNDGTVTSPYFNFSVGESINSSSAIKKNTTDAANSTYAFLANRIFVNGGKDINISQLFSNFGFVRLETNTVYVIFNGISNLNTTTAFVDKNSSDRETVAENILKIKNLMFEQEVEQEKVMTYYVMMTPKEGKLERVTSNKPKEE